VGIIQHKTEFTVREVENMSQTSTDSALGKEKRQGRRATIVEKKRNPSWG